MASCCMLIKSREIFFEELQHRVNVASADRKRRHLAAITSQRLARGYLIRKHIAWLNYNATIIQCAFRVHQVRKRYRHQLIWFVNRKFGRYYYKNAQIIQSLWRGYKSRRLNFCYRSYRRWLRTVSERGERRVAENAEFRTRSRIDDLKILEDEARQWLALVIFKLHHLLRTYVVAGIYSNPASHELSEFEKVIKSIRYREYMRRLKCKYEEFVKKHKAKFNNKTLFPIIGYGEEYWYLTLPEMHELTAPVPKAKADTRHKALHHGLQHKQPFLWRKPRHAIPNDFLEGRGPFAMEEGKAELLLPKSAKRKSNIPDTPPPTRKATVLDVGAGDASSPYFRDPRFQLYVTHYKPRPDVLEYIDFHINAVLARKLSIQKLKLLVK